MNRKEEFLISKINIRVRFPNLGFRGSGIPLLPSHGGGSWDPPPTLPQGEGPGIPLLPPPMGEDPGIPLQPPPWGRVPWPKESQSGKNWNTVNNTI